MHHRSVCAAATMVATLASNTDHQRTANISCDGCAIYIPMLTITGIKYNPALTVIIAKKVGP